ncbi:MAG: ankyrin repeat domain-containing protein, partial [Acidobacteria bacterium]|nr:ankyrin repeat domain-containing protein [Acidobacteriota bacterium]
MKIGKRWIGLAALLTVLGVLVGAGYAALLSPVLDAAKRGDVESLKAELRSGADVNAAQGDGFTALHWAAKLGNREVADVLIAAGADLEATTRLGGHMPLHVAAAAGKAGGVEALLVGGAPAGAMTLTGAEPIHLAAAAGVPEVVTALIAHGASVDARETEWGLTALMFAAVRGRVEAVKTLMEAGADAAATANVLDVVERAKLDMQERREREARLAEIRGGSGVLQAERPLPANGTDRRPGAGTGGTGGGAAPPDPLDPYSDLDPNEPRPKTYEDRVGTHGGLTA